MFNKLFKMSFAFNSHDFSALASSIFVGNHTSERAIHDTIIAFAKTRPSIKAAKSPKKIFDKITIIKYTSEVNRLTMAINGDVLSAEFNEPLEFIKKAVKGVSVRKPTAKLQARLLFPKENFQEVCEILDENEVPYDVVDEEPSSTRAKSEYIKFGDALRNTGEMDGLSFKETSIYISKKWDVAPENPKNSPALPVPVPISTSPSKINTSPTIKKITPEKPLSKMLLTEMKIVAKRINDENGIKINCALKKAELASQIEPYLDTPGYTLEELLAMKADALTKIAQSKEIKGISGKTKAILAGMILADQNKAK